MTGGSQTTTLVVCLGRSRSIFSLLFSGNLGPEVPTARHNEWENRRVWRAPELAERLGEPAGQIWPQCQLVRYGTCLSCNMLSWCEVQASDYWIWLIDVSCLVRFRPTNSRNIPFRFQHSLPRGHCGDHLQFGVLGHDERSDQQPARAVPKALPSDLGVAQRLFSVLAHLHAHPLPCPMLAWQSPFCLYVQRLSVGCPLQPHDLLLRLHVGARTG